MKTAFGDLLRMTSGASGLALVEIPGQISCVPWSLFVKAIQDLRDSRDGAKLPEKMAGAIKVTHLQPLGITGSVSGLDGTVIKVDFGLSGEGLPVALLSCNKDRVYVKTDALVDLVERMDEAKGIVEDGVQMVYDDLKDILGLDALLPAVG